MVFDSKPVQKTEIQLKNTTGFVDVTTYVLDNSNLNLTVGQKISGGVIKFDKTILDVLPTLEPLDEIKVTVGDTTADTHIFTGYLRDNDDRDATENIIFKIKSFAILASDRDATEVFRDDAGTGDPTEVFKDLVDKYLPELHYDGTSIPPTAAGIENFTNYRLQNIFLKVSFDFIANYLGLIWFVDKDKKIWLVVQSFTDSGLTLTTGDNIIGNLTEAIGLRKFANRVTVDGKHFDVGFNNNFTAGAAQTKFTLTQRPKSLTVTVDGTTQTGALPDTDFAANADYLVDPDEPSITFLAAMSGGEDVDVNGFFVTKIHDEREDAGSINALKYKKTKNIVDENIETLEKAKEIGINYLSNNSRFLKIYSGATFWNENALPGNKVTLVDTDRSINQKVNVLQINFIFGATNFEMRFKVNNDSIDAVDLYEDLVNRVRRLEFNLRSSGQNIAKYLFFGANFAIEGLNISIEDEGIGNSWTFDHPNGTFDDNSIFWDGNDGSGSLIDNGEVVVLQANNTYIERFETDHYKDAGNTTADWDVSTKEIDLTVGETIRTKILLKNGIAYSKAFISIEGTNLGNLTLKMSADAGSNTETVTNNSTHTFTDTSIGGIFFQADATGSATITKIKIQGIV